MINRDVYFNFAKMQNRFKWRRVVYIALFWTIIDVIYSLLAYYSGHKENTEIISILPRAVLVFVMSLVMAYLFIFTFKNVLRNQPLWINFLAKAGIVLSIALLMNFIVNLIEVVIINGGSALDATFDYYAKTFEPNYLIGRTMYWLAIFLVTQLILEINDKYSPGVFFDILVGKYRNPKVENRVVMFLDLKDSTPIAEKLGHEQYFLFIREFIKQVSHALIMHEAIIYQYVGDEIVSSWPLTNSNVRKSIGAVISARTQIQKRSNYFRNKFGVVPEFRVGIHAGEVTIGEIGVVKKDLAMSGDTMNTAARIRSITNELNYKFIVSKIIVEHSNLADWQIEDLGPIEMKGKSEGVELYALKM